MTVDEFYCHRRRELGVWERLGHPLDTLFFVMALTVLVWTGSLAWFTGFAVFSTLFITKDEWQHQKLCTGFENWLHALLFVLHPVVFLTAGWLVWSGSELTKPLIGGTIALASAFGLYQAVYWNFLKTERRDQRGVESNALPLDPISEASRIRG